MPRTGKRITVAKGIYKDSSGFEVRVMVNRVPHLKRFPLETPLDDLKRARRQMKGRAETEHPKPRTHTLAADAPKYLKLMAHLASMRNRRAHLDAWIALYGDRYRHQITRAEVLNARVHWINAKVAPKTINHRVMTLRHLYRTLDGRTAETPCDEVLPLPVPKTPIRRVSDDVILTVDRNLQARELDPKIPLRDPKTRARFRVLVSTGRRPSELMRAQPSDVDLTNRVWVVRDGKGGWSPGIYLNDDMLEAWKLFIAANAWGEYSTSSYACAIRAAGWPADVRPYNARHTAWIMAVERGADMADVQLGAGHKSLATTRIYTGVRNSRMQRLSETLEGRFGKFMSPDSASNSKPQDTQD